MPSQEGKGGNSLIYQLKFQAQAGHRPLSMVGVSCFRLGLFSSDYILLNIHFIWGLDFVIPLHFLFFAGCKLEQP